MPTAFATPLTPEQGYLVAKNLRLALFLAGKFRPAKRFRDAEDYQGEALLALALAARSYDPANEGGVPFAAYARRLIVWTLRALVRAGRREGRLASDPAVRDALSRLRSGRVAASAQAA